MPSTRASRQLPAYQTIIPTTPSSNQTIAPITANVQLDAELFTARQNALALRQEERCAGTKRAYGPKQMEWKVRFSVIEI